MSAYIVSDECMQLAVAAVVRLGFPVELASLLGRQCWAMNAEAVSQRYSPDEWTTRARDQSVSWEFQPPGVGEADPWSRGSAISKLIYQCAEGDVPETWRLYQLLNSLYERAKRKAEER